VIASAKILVFDSSPASPLADALCELLEQSFDVSLEIRRIPGGDLPPTELLSRLTRTRADVAIIMLEGDRPAKLLEALETRDATAAARMPALVTVQAHNDPRETAALLQAGIADYILPPLDTGHVVPRLLRLLPAEPRARPQPEPGSSYDRLIGHSAAFVAEVEKLPVIAQCDTGVLIEGETGTGKELFARAIHELSPRRAKPFVPVNCGAIPVELAESELFGHERGAFTGAYAAQAGMIAIADGGTLFLDEVCSLPLLTQAKLLRFLQEKEYRPIGSGTTRRANVRVIAAANNGLERAVQQGQFRQDLYYRLNIIHVPLPPLRQRREDIPLLAAHFLRTHADRLGRPVLRFTPAAGEKLLRHDWPGNVRELEHVIERALVFSGGSVMDENLILTSSHADDDPGADSFKEAKAKTVADFERSYIEGLLAVHHGNISHAARHAGKNRRAFWELIRKYGVETDRFRAPAAPGVSV